MVYKVSVGNGLDSVEAVLNTEQEVLTYLETKATLIKQALKALSATVPIVVEQKATANNTQTTQVGAPIQPTPQRPPAAVCPKCSKATYYEREVKSGKQAGWIKHNKGLALSVGAKYYECKSCGEVGVKQ
jgi:hypothetical protein